MDLEPFGPFGVIYADPPWRFETWTYQQEQNGVGVWMSRNQQRQNRPERHYQTMTMEEIMALPVGKHAARDCVLFLWAVDPLLPHALLVGKSWGFTYKTVGFVWVKQRRNLGIFNKRPHVSTRPFPMGTGYWTRGNPEICLLFTRGRPKRLSASVEKLIVAPRAEHSRKPDEARQRIEQLAAGPYLELFARHYSERWIAWGTLQAG